MNNNYLEQELKIFRKYFEKDFKSNIPLLNIILNYIIKAKGKQMRPKFVLTAADMFGTINDATYSAASLIELLHTATLVHDDVVDDAYQRRSMFSINALWKNKIAVLAGDYLLSKGMINALEGNHFELLKTVSTAVKLMSEGELLQIEKARKLDINETVYYEIIKNKTASLLAAACASGAYSVTNDLDIKNKMWQFGEHVGMSFQIKDDLLDYGVDNIGKPLGIDIKEKKMTLPIIYTLNNCEKDLRKKIIYAIKNKSNDKDTIHFVVEQVKIHGGIDYATQVMLSYQEKAINLLSDIPDSAAKKAMTELVSLTTKRKK